MTKLKNASDVSDSKSELAGGAPQNGKQRPPTRTARINGQWLTGPNQKGKAFDPFAAGEFVPDSDNDNGSTQSPRKKSR